MRRFKHLIALVLFAVSMMTVAAAVPTFGDLKAAPVAAHDCECPEGCPQDMPDCPNLQHCAVAVAPVAVLESQSMALMPSPRGQRFALTSNALDSLTRAPPLHPPRL